MAPVRFTAPSEVISPADAMVNAPTSPVSETIPPAAVFRLPLTATASFETEIPPLAVVPTAWSVPVVKSPKLRVVVPLPVVCAKLAARIPLAVTLAALEIVKAPRGVVFPTNPVNTTFPAVPAVRPRFLGVSELSLLIVPAPAKLMLLSLVPSVSIATLAPRTVAPVKVTVFPP